MKKFIHRIQDLSQKAAHWKQVLEAAPGQAAQLRDTVLMSAGQLQQLRQEVQSTATGLRADNDTRLAQALREIHDGARTFLEAGYALTGIDMDLSPVQRLIVHLEKLEDVPEPAIRSLLSDNSGKQTVYAILAALSKADGVSEKVHVSHLTYRELIIHVGPVPSVRLCWRADELVEESAEHHALHRGVEAPPPLPSQHPQPPSPPRSPHSYQPPPPTQPAPAFTQSTYFEQRSTGATPRATPSGASGPAAVPGSEAASPQASLAPTSSHGDYGHRSEAPAGGDWKRSALDRFKKMPEGSKYRR